MKTFKLMLLTLIVTISFSSCTAQRTVVKVYPKHGTVVTTLSKPRVIVHQKRNFYFANGVWYKAQGRKYVVCAAPVGIKVRQLPRGNKLVVVNGRKLYNYKGVWYKKSGKHYIVVNV